MNASKIFLSPSEYFILNKDLIKKIGIEPTIVLCSLINEEEKKQKKMHSYFLTTIDTLTEETTLSIFKIKNALNKLYKTKLIDIVVKNDHKVSIKILHSNIMQQVTSQQSNKKPIHQIKKNQKIKNTRFKKPTLKELSQYFMELGVNTDESSIMFDYYESKGWKVGKAPMKCWKSATRNWVRRIQKKTDFPDYYDKKLETQICDDPEALSKYHNHLKKLGWESIYSPSAGTTWKKKKLSS